MPRVKAEPAPDTPGPEAAEAEGATPAASPDGKGDDAKHTGNEKGTRRNANGSVSSVYSGNKIRHLKKEDGVPLWRKDIQYDFLKAVFEDDKRVFHKKSDGSFGHSFADIYLDAMAKSSKCSKILKDKLLTERPQALNMAMVCLLVNVGRMNTTLNFFPEMRAQLRTYHSIPSLQAHQDPNAYKQLQDAPRLKSILKGATEDYEQPSTIEDIQAAEIPRTNPVNLIFVLSQFAPKISEVHFDVPRDFFDLVMKESLSSSSRARAFLWLMWWYLESDFTEKAAEENPYGPGRSSSPDKTELPLKCPQFDYLTQEEEDAENVDTPEEQEFGELKRLEREAILKTDMAPVITGPKRTGNKRVVTHFILNHLNEANSPSPLNAAGQSSFDVASVDGASSPGRDPHSPAPPPPPPPRGGVKSKTLSGGAFINRVTDQPYDTDRTRSASPPAHHTSTFSVKPIRINPAVEGSPAPTPPAAKPKGPGRGNWRRNREGQNHTPRSFAAKLDLDNASQASSTAPGGTGPHGYYLPLSGAEPSHRRSRPLTSHQQLVEKYRKDRVDHILDRGWRRTQALSGKKREAEGALSRAWKRCKFLPSAYDSEEELEAWNLRVQQQSGPNSQHASALEAADALLTLAGLKRANWERQDWGEESVRLGQGMRKVKRRLNRWERGEKAVKRLQNGQSKKRRAQDDEQRGIDSLTAPRSRIQRLKTEAEDDISDVGSSSPPRDIDDTAMDLEDGDNDAEADVGGEVPMPEMDPYESGEDEDEDPEAGMEMEDDDEDDDDTIAEEDLADVAVEA